MARTVEFQIIDLRGSVRSDAGIEFLRAELPTGLFQAPFAVIRYSLYGEEQPYGLRLDLDKRVFIDHFEKDIEKESFLQSVVNHIVSVVNSVSQRSLSTETLPTFTGNRSVQSMEERQQRREWPEAIDRKWNTKEQVFQGRKHIFINYSHKDEEWGRLFLSHLEQELEPSTQFQGISVCEVDWVGRQKNWRQGFQETLESSKVVILLISSNFLASEFVTTNMMVPLLEEARREGAIILPVFVEPVPLHEIKWLNEFEVTKAPFLSLKDFFRKGQYQLDKITELVRRLLQG